MQSAFCFYFSFSNQKVSTPSFIVCVRSRFKLKCLYFLKIPYIVLHLSKILERDDFLDRIPIYFHLT